MSTPRPVTIDVETYGIAGRPDYPPMPVGVAIKYWDEAARYYGFGHIPSGDHDVEWNNSTALEALLAVKKAYECPDGILFHNCKFDLDCAEVHFGLAPPSWDRVHDSMFLLFLDDPNQREIGLKPAAQRLLDWPPEERDAVADWLVEHQPVEDVRISRAARGREPAGKYIAHAPTSIVGPYAIGDVERTAALFALLWPIVQRRGMGEAYDRERRLVPVLLDMERRGVPVDVPRLATDVAAYRAVLGRLEGWLRTRLGTEEINLDSGEQLIEALTRKGLIDRNRVGVTPRTGKPRSDKETIAAAVTDPQMAATLRYVGLLRTALSTFMEPWLATSAASGGLIYTSWNQTRGAGGGARTGRFSSSPNFQNIPKVFRDPFANTDPPFPNLPDPPRCRGYITARPGEVLGGRDFSGQELRILAHFEDGPMLQAYREDPGVDFHQLAIDLINHHSHFLISRDHVKIVGFSLLYGAGAGRIAASIGCPLEIAQEFIAAWLKAFPGVAQLKRELTAMARAGEEIVTIGGRRYLCEPPAVVEGRYRTFDYRLLNTLIQGSAADQTKQAMIDFHERAGPGKMLLTVHDEIVISTAPESLEADMAILAEVMARPMIDTPLRSDGEAGHTWATMEKAA